MAKKDARLVKSVDEFKGVLTWNFNVEGEEPLEFNVAAQYEEFNKLYPIGARAMMHGFKQKISDAGAVAADTATGKVDQSARIAKMRRMAETLASGQWELTRTGGGGNTGGLLARAIAEAMGKDITTVREFLKGKTEAEKAGLRNHGPIAKVLARLEAEQATEVDPEALLGDLLG